MINWKELTADMKKPLEVDDGLQNYRQGYLGNAFESPYNDGLLALALAVVRQWVIDRKRATEYPFVLPWLEYIRWAIPDLLINDDDLLTIADKRIDMEDDDE